MSDIIDIIDGLHAKATKGPVYRSEPSGIIDSSRGVFIAGGTWPHEGALLVELYNAWPALSARLREAERERDEWKLASSKNGDAMSGYQSRAIVAEQQLEGAKRERDAALAKLSAIENAIRFRSDATAKAVGDIIGNPSEPPNGSPQPAPPDGRVDEALSGRTLRDWFAGQALVGVIQTCNMDTINNGTLIEQHFAGRAYAIAAERAANGGTDGH